MLTDLKNIWTFRDMVFELTHRELCLNKKTVCYSRPHECFKCDSFMTVLRVTFSYKIKKCMERGIVNMRENRKMNRKKEIAAVKSTVGEKIEKNLSSFGALSAVAIVRRSFPTAFTVDYIK